MRIISYLISIAIICVSVGCVSIFVGKDFKKEPIKDIVVGKTTKAEIINSFGVPYNENKVTFNNTEFEIFNYLYSFLDYSTNKQMKKELRCEFKNGLLNSYNFVSTFEDDRIRIDKNKLNTLEKGKTTKSAVQNVLCIPHGIALIPTSLLYRPPSDIKDVKELWVYYSSKNDTVMIFFDLHGLFLEFNITSEGKTL